MLERLIFSARIETIDHSWCMQLQRLRIPHFHYFSFYRFFSLIIFNFFYHECYFLSVYCLFFNQANWLFSFLYSHCWPTYHDQRKIHWTNWAYLPFRHSMRLSVLDHHHCWIIYWQDVEPPNDDHLYYHAQIVDQAVDLCR